MTNRSLKAVVLDLMTRAHAAQRTLAEGLSDEERAAIGTPESWSAKDLIAHNATWVQRQAIRLAAGLRGETPPDFEHFQEINEQVFAEQRERPFAEVLADDDRAWAELMSYVQEYSEEDLRDPQRFAWLQGRPLLGSVLGNGFFHPVGHLVQHYHARGEHQRARELNEALLGHAAQLEELPEIRGDALYNLACHHALVGDHAQAIPMLREALALRPNLREWSQEDPDFASIRDTPEYKAIYE